MSKLWATVGIAAGLLMLASSCSSGAEGVSEGDPESTVTRVVNAPTTPDSDNTTGGLRSAGHTRIRISAHNRPYDNRFNRYRDWRR